MGEKGYFYEPRKRFSSRVENYVKYRPSYPKEIIPFLEENGILSKDSIIADIGSGTGILSKLFLQNKNLVYGIEPNDKMRNAAEKIFKNDTNFISLKGSAENTGLNRNSVHLITIGQAFHWFNIELAKIEFRRILKEDGYVIVIWNSRKKTGNDFSIDYERLVSNFGKDYKQVRMNENTINDFYKYKIKKFDNYQDFDFMGLKGRLLSSSYTPLENDPEFDDMIKYLKEIYQKHQKRGKIRFEYNTMVYYGKLNN
jgi:ubiquinone/menaquinone biosynthesis C-methylase UbiE